MIQFVKTGEIFLNDSNTSIHNFTIEKEIAVGESLNKVYKGTFNGKSAVLKVMDKDCISFSQEYFNIEVLLMHLFKHKRISSALAASISPPNLFVISKFYSRGSLGEILKNNQEDLSLPLIVKMCIDVASGYLFLYLYSFFLLVLLLLFNIKCCYYFSFLIIIIFFF